MDYLAIHLSKISPEVLSDTIHGKFVLICSSATSFAPAHKRPTGASRAGERPQELGR